MFNPTHRVFTNETATQPWGEAFELDESQPNLYRKEGSSYIGEISSDVNLIETYRGLAHKGIVVEELPRTLENE